MEKSKVIRIATTVLVTICALFVAGCSETIVRENILSSIETGIGLTVAENKQTQMYELKAGYIRSQFYSIPTGKVVKTDNPATFLTMSSCTKINNIPVGKVDGKEAPAFLSVSTCRMIVANNKSGPVSNRTDITPELVSGIRAHQGLQDLLFGMDVSESFAVGKEAVKSQAAVAMYIAMADDAKKSAAAANAINALTYDSNDSTVDCIDDWLDKDEKNIKTLNDWWDTNSLKGKGVLAISAKENSEVRKIFLKEHADITCK